MRNSHTGAYSSAILHPLVSSLYIQPPQCLAQW
jgi:hypothetical protein